MIHELLSEFLALEQQLYYIQIKAPLLPGLERQAKIHQIRDAWRQIAILLPSFQNIAVHQADPFNFDTRPWDLSKSGPLASRNYTLRLRSLLDSRRQALMSAIQDLQSMRPSAARNHGQLIVSSMNLSIWRLTHSFWVHTRVSLIPNKRGS